MVDINLIIDVANLILLLREQAFTSTIVTHLDRTSMFIEQVEWLKLFSENNASNKWVEPNTNKGIEEGAGTLATASGSPLPPRSLVFSFVSMPQDLL